MEKQKEQEPKKERVYISGPITGYDLEERKAVFAEAERKLQEIGFETFNPLNNTLPFDTTHEEYMRQDLKTLLNCDVIAMLGDYQESRGARLEYVVALECGLKVIYV